LFFFITRSNAQDNFSASSNIDKTTVGIGMGLDFGGFGANLLIYPHKNIGLFAGGGYAIAGFGFNAGIKIRLVSDNPDKKVTPYALVMYGYNAAIAVSNAAQYNKLFYGPTAGIGIDYRSNPDSRGYWSFALLIPIRSSEVDSYIDDLKENRGVEFKNDLLPIGISIGYRIIIN
jgi:hypothetical protein